MHGRYGNPNEVAREIGGSFRPGQDRIVRPSKFGPVCKVLWPENTDAHVAAIGKVDPRTVRRWFNEEFDPPVAVVLAVIQEMLSRK
jgi:hypothetical protein